MLFQNESAAITALAELILDAAANLYKTTKYIYALGKHDFYRCDVKDVFKITLNNIVDTEKLRALGLIATNDQCAELNCPEYTRVFSLLAYSFAVRLPTLKTLGAGGDVLTDGQIRMIYDKIIAKGVVNHGDAVPESFGEIRTCVRRGKPVPPYSAEWYRTYLYSSVPTLKEISNCNLFLFGATDLLFVQFYLCLEKELIARLASLRQAT